MTRTLTAYKRKRNFKRTFEPAGTAREEAPKALHFVVQKHWASRLHYDFRLEHGSVLKSWAVPRDPPVNAGGRRLAILVEDHPLEYRAFEGNIPRGNYGAGAVIIWDEGTYSVTGSESAAESERRFEAGFAKGRLDLTLRGSELKGAYALVRMAGAKRWLLIRKKDASRPAGRREENPIITNERSDERARSRAARKIRGGDLSELDLRGAVYTGKMPPRVEPMLATFVDKPFDRAGWIFEIKWDGYRAISSVRFGSVSLYSRNDKLLNEKFPAVVRELRGLPFAAIFDGEIVALDNRGRPDFQLLRNYPRTSRGRLVYYVFDILYLNGYDLQPMPLLRRKQILREVLSRHDHLGLSYYVPEGGRSFFAAASENGFEGIMAKDGSSPYREGVRGDDWLKIKVVRRESTGNAASGGCGSAMPPRLHDGRGHRAKYGVKARRKGAKVLPRRRG